jgi:hypothetical protein
MRFVTSMKAIVDFPRRLAEELGFTLPTRITRFMNITALCVALLGAFVPVLWVKWMSGIVCCIELLVVTIPVLTAA